MRSIIIIKATSASVHYYISDSKNCSSDRRLRRQVTSLQNSAYRCFRQIFCNCLFLGNLQARRGSEPSFERTAFSGASHAVGDSQDPQDAPPNNLTKTGLASGSVQAVVASINAMSSKSQNGWNRHQDFTRHRSKSTLGPNQLWPPASSSALENEQRSTLRSSLRMTMVKGRSHEEHHQGNDDIYISHANSGSLRYKGSSQILPKAILFFFLDYLGLGVLESCIFKGFI